MSGAAKPRRWAQGTPDTTAGSRGLSLFELVVAMALFAMVATLGLQALSGTMQIGSRLGEVSARVGAESRAVTLMRQDLSRMVGLRFHPPDGDGIGQGALLLSADKLRLSFSIAGQHGDLSGVGAGAGLHRVEWRLDPATGQMSRRIWPLLAPTRASQQTPEVVWLHDVVGLRLRSYSRETGWVDGVQPESGSPLSEAGIDPGSLDGDQLRLPDYNSDRLPLALEVEIIRRNGDRLRLLEVLG